MKIAYWDTEQGARPPSLIGDIRGTPTIKYYYPKKKKNKNNKKKATLDYQYDRKLKAMKRFAIQNMPSFIERVKKENIDEFTAKADKYGLPYSLIFSKSSSPKPLLKYASTEYRRKMLVGMVNTQKPGGKSLMEKFGVKKPPGVVVFPGGGKDPVVFEKKISHHKLMNFLGKYALKQPVSSIKKKTGSAEKDEM